MLVGLVVLALAALLFSFVTRGAASGIGASEPAASPPPSVVALGRLLPMGELRTLAAPFGAGDARVAQVLRAAGLVLDMSGHQATLDDRVLDLTPTEFDLLAVLLQNPGRAFTRLELLDRVQGDAYESYERTIDAHIKNLRAKLGDDPRHPRHIQTVFGVGYKLGGDL